MVNESAVADQSWRPGLTERGQMRLTNTDSEAKDGQTSQGILDNVRLAGTVESGGGPVVLVVVRRLRDPAVARQWGVFCIVDWGDSTYFPRGIFARVVEIIKS